MAAEVWRSCSEQTFARFEVNAMFYGGHLQIANSRQSRLPIGATTSDAFFSLRDFRRIAAMRLSGHRFVAVGGGERLRACWNGRGKGHPKGWTTNGEANLIEWILSMPMDTRCCS